MLSQLNKHINKNYIGLYRDDGLANLKNNSGPEAEKRKKNFEKLFKEKDLDIIVQFNSKITNYLDITLNLNDDTYPTYRKPNKETKYIHVNSDHPPSIINEIPHAIEERRSTLSSPPKNTFQESAIHCEQYLKNSGYKTKLQYHNQKKTIKVKRKQNATSFGSSHEQQVTLF